jgi:Uma2 family endonuclease
MSTDVTRPQAPVEYPDSDGKPMADNTLQFEWIVTLKEGLELLLADRADVFVAGDLLWYPVEGDNKTRMAPDALVAFGRPKGYRGSYRQWEEAGVAPQVVFEVLSPGNRAAELRKKLAFYDRFGVDEYYVYDPYKIRLSAYLRRDGRLDPLPTADGWTSPRLGIRFELHPDTLVVLRPDGRPFLTALETGQSLEHEFRRATAERQRAEAERQRAERLAEKLRALGIDPDEA